jgi:uncharacterized protein YbjQ (UPF0145 family)
MIISTSEIKAENYTVLGMVKGCSVCSRSLIGDLASAIKNLLGGELTAYSTLLERASEGALIRMQDEAEKLGANAIMCVRFTSSNVTTGGAEFIAYGTAIKIE